MQQRAEHIPELDGIRGIACLMIVSVHCVFGPWDASGNPVTAAIDAYTTGFFLGGVDFFFVLSGLLIGGILIDGKSMAPRHYFGSFWTRRVARIFPPLYVLVVAYVIMQVVASQVDIPALDLWLLMPPHYSPFWYFTFTQSIPMAIGGYEGGGPQWLRPTWSVAVEEQFYLLFPFIVYFVSRRTLTLVVLAAIIIPFIARPFIWNQNWYAAYVLLPFRMDAIAFGVLVAIIVRQEVLFPFLKRVRYLVALLAMGALYYAIFRANPNARLTSLGAGFGLTILSVFLFEGSLFNRALRWKPLTFVGMISYALYLFHQPVNGLVHAIVFNQEPTIRSWLEFAATLAAITLAGTLATLSFYAMENPIRQRARRFIASWTAKPGPVAAKAGTEPAE